MDERNWSLFACPNPQCPLYARREAGNIRPHGWSSKKQGIRCLRCRECGRNFSERAGTPFHGLKSPQEKLVSICEHLAEGNGMRSTGRLCRTSLNTVLRVAGRVGRHAEAFHDQMVAHVPVEEVQIDEAWSFVGKKRTALRSQ